MSVSGPEQPEGNELDEIRRLNSHHAREMAAVNAAHANVVIGLKEHFQQELERLQREIARLEQQLKGLAK